MSTLTDDGFQLLEGARIKSALTFIEKEWGGGYVTTRNALIMACLASDPVHRMLFKVLQMESSAHGQFGGRQRLPPVRTHLLSSPRPAALTD